MILLMALFVLDATTPFPTPMRGAFAGEWLLGAIAAFGVWLWARRLPIGPALDLLQSRDHKGRIDIHTLGEKLKISPRGARKLTNALVANGNVRTEGDAVSPDLVLLISRDGSAYKSDWVCRDCIQENAGDRDTCSICNKSRSEVEAPETA